MALVAAVFSACRWAARLRVRRPRGQGSATVFPAGRTGVLKRFVLEDKAGIDRRLWGPAQALSALCPAGSDEKRWVDGVLARKKGLGL
jgi:hypothetical protein